jgi:hypothetical protein
VNRYKHKQKKNKVMLFLMKYGEGPSTTYDPSISERFTTSVNEYFAPQEHCKHGKVHSVCGAKSIVGTCFCERHYADERKDYIRHLYEGLGVYLPRDRPLLEDFTGRVDGTWKEFNDVLTRSDGESALNTLSLIIEIDAPCNFDLSRVLALLTDAGDRASSGSSAVSSMDTSFNNVVEFTALVEGDTSTAEKRVLFNASVKLWHNRQIHVCGCRNINSALRICSSVVRVLKLVGVCPESARVTAVNPVFANASFDFFPHVLVISVLQSHAFLETIRAKLTGTDMSVTPDSTSYQKTTEAVFRFSRPHATDVSKVKTTTIKVYPRGNVIITFNNFDGKMLQRALQLLGQAAEEHDAFLRTVQQKTISVDSSATPFSFTPRTTTPTNVTSSSSLTTGTTTTTTPSDHAKKQTFSMRFLLNRTPSSSTKKNA